MINRKLDKLIFLLSLIFLIILNPAEKYSQNIGTLRGLVTDSTTTEALPYCNVFIRELLSGASTDSRGYFLIPSVPSNKEYTLVISYMGYEKKELEVIVAPGKVTHIDIQLKPTSVELQVVEKIGEKVIEKNDTDISVQRIAIKELEALPKGVETDIIRSLQYMPGVQSTGDVSARFYVRGGSSNQNLISLDNIPIYSPFHALGLFSVIDPELVNNVEFHKGGFGAEFGGRVSSVLKVITKDGNKNKLGSKFSSSYLSGKALLEGPLPHGSFILSGRKSYSSKILNKFLNKQNIPIDFYDLAFKLNYSFPDFLKGGKFIVNGFCSGDNITNSDPKVEDFKWDNKLFGFRWFQVGDSPLFLEVGLAFSQFHGESIPKLSDARINENEVTDISLNMDFTYMFNSRDELGVGFHIKQLDTKLHMQNSNGIISEIGNSGANISLYAKYIFQRFENLGVDIGARLNLTGLAENSANMSLFEPRISFTYNIFPSLAFKGAWGIYQQELTTLSDENEVINIFEPWVVIPDYLEPTVSTHYIMGIETKPFEDLTLSVEAYFVNTQNLAVINYDKIFSGDPDFIEGKSESSGLEGMLSYALYPFNINMSYTYAFAYKEVNKILYYPRYDARNSFNISLSAKLGAGWEASAMWIYSSGLPFTQLIGYYNKLYLKNYFDSSWHTDLRKPYTLLATRNLGRLPDYHRLDINLSKKFTLSSINFSLDMSIVNVYDRENVFYFERDTGKRVNMLPFLPTATIKVEL